MLQKIKITLMSLAASLMFAVPLAVPAAVSAQSGPIQNGVCQGANNPTNPFPGNLSNTPNANCNSTQGTTGINELIRTVINILTIIVGVIAVIMIIVGGLQYITSGGSSEKVSKAKNTILYAIIGLIIVALAQIIVRFVLDKTATI